jgi:adenylate kinase
MKLILLGPAGAGKGTVAAALSRELHIPSISTGDLFRETAASDTERGRRIREIMESGELVPDDITVAMLKDRLGKGDTGRGFILDGFPRTVNQAEALSKIASMDKVLNLVIADEIIIRRLSGRRVCGNCGAVYHAEHIKPKKSGICDRCGGNLITRDDDKPEAVRNRLVVYKEKTAPLIQYYRDLGILADVDASGTPEEVFASAQKSLP